MNNSRRTWIGIAIIALVALAIVALPSGPTFKAFVNNTVNSVFLVLVGISLVALYRNQRPWLVELSDRDRGIIYGSCAIALLTLVAWPRFRDLTGGGIILVILILSACGFAIYWVWRESRKWMI